MIHMKPLRSKAWLAAVALCTLSAAATAQDWPNRPIRAVVPFPAGSATDIIARTLTDRMGTALGQSVVVDNRAGASGTIGQSAVAQAAPDGYTILIHSSSHTVSPSTFAKLPFDTLKDFAGITPVAALSNVLVIAPSKKLTTLDALLTFARANPGRLNYASAGQGSATHLNAEKFKLAAGIDAVHIPFKGSSELITEVIAGRVDYYFSPIAPVIGHIESGRLLPLAVGSAERSPTLPKVPTTAEAGVPSSEFGFWIGMMAPAGTPREIVQRLHDEAVKVLSTDEVKQRFADLGVQVWTMAPERFDACIAKEIDSNTELVKAAGLLAKQ